MHGVASHPALHTVHPLSAQERPFMMLKRAENGSKAQFEGFCVDLLERVAELVGFRYHIELVPVDIFGHQNAQTGEWDGLVRQLIDKVRGDGLVRQLIDKVKGDGLVGQLIDKVRGDGLVRQLIYKVRGGRCETADREGERVRAVVVVYAYSVCVFSPRCSFHSMRSYPTIDTISPSLKS